MKGKYSNFVKKAYNNNQFYDLIMGINDYANIQNEISNNYFDGWILPKMCNIDLYRLVNDIKQLIFDDEIDQKIVNNELYVTLSKMINNDAFAEKCISLIICGILICQKSNSRYYVLSDVLDRLIKNGYFPIIFHSNEVLNDDERELLDYCKIEDKKQLYYTQKSLIDYDK